MDTLSELLSSKVRAEIFRLLFGIKEEYLHVREIERRSGLAIGTVQQESRKLLRLGLITRRKDGNRVYYEANKNHPLYEEIHRMVLKTSGLVDVLRKRLDTSAVSCAIVFGSIAAGTETPDSDIDLLVIGSIGLRCVAKRLSGVAEVVGREINPHVMTVGEFSRRAEKNEHLVKNILKGERLFVTGTENDFEAMVG